MSKYSTTSKKNLATSSDSSSNVLAGAATASLRSKSAEDSLAAVQGRDAIRSLSTHRTLALWGPACIGAAIANVPRWAHVILRACAIRSRRDTAVADTVLALSAIAARGASTASVSIPKSDRHALLSRWAIRSRAARAMKAGVAIVAIMAIAERVARVTNVSVPLLPLGNVENALVSYERNLFSRLDCNLRSTASALPSPAPLRPIGTSQSESMAFRRRSHIRSFRSPLVHCAKNFRLEFILKVHGVGSERRRGNDQEHEECEDASHSLTYLDIRGLNNDV